MPLFFRHLNVEIFLLFQAQNKFSFFDLFFFFFFNSWNPEIRRVHFTSHVTAKLTLQYEKELLRD